MSKEKVKVLGSGLMGAGITQVCLENGFETLMVDLNLEFVNKGKKTIKNLRIMDNNLFKDSMFGLREIICRGNNM